MEQNLDLSGEEGGQTAMAADGTVLPRHAEADAMRLESARKRVAG